MDKNLDSKKIDFLAIGDIVMDEFVRLKDAEVLTNHSTLELCMRFGDKIPFEYVKVIKAVHSLASSSRMMQKSLATFQNITEKQLH